jgi:CRISPR/Cas system-associated protein Cas7 (RAMP superfamily)
MSSEKTKLTHVAGTFLVQADGAFLNGAGLGEGEDRNVTIPKTFRDGRNEVPYVSAQAWKRWLRNTATQEAGWPASEPQAIGWNPKGNVNKIAGQLNPVEFPEDDIFGYMRAQEGQGRRRASSDDEDEGDEEAVGAKTRAVMRASPFAASLLISLRSVGWRGQDEGFVHLTKYDPRALAEAEVMRFLAAVSGEKQDKTKDVWKRLEEFGKPWASEVRSAADELDLERLRELLSKKASEEKREVNFIENATSPLPYSTRFYNTNLQAVFCLDYSRLGVFWNVGDRIELEESKAKKFLADGKIEDVTGREPYKSLTRDGAMGKIFRLVNGNNVRRDRAADLFKALAVLRGGAKQAQFGTDIAPKVLILAGLTCGNPVFNHLFRDDGDSPMFKIDTFKELIADYSDRIATPILFGIRAGYVRNECDVRGLEGWWKVTAESSSRTKLDGPTDHKPPEGQSIEVRVITPIEAARKIGELLP